MPDLGIDELFGTKVTARWLSGYVKVAFDGGAEVNAFALAEESDVSIDPLSDGRWAITYMAASVVTQKFSSDEVTWA